MALTDCNLFRITANTSCIIYFDNCVTCDYDSIEVPYPSIWYVSHCTGSTSTPTVTNGTIELLTTQPETFYFETCFNNDPVPTGYTIHGQTSQFTVPGGRTVYFSGISSYGGSFPEYPCSLEGCLAYQANGIYDETNFYCAYWYDNINQYDVCGQCSTDRTGLGDPLWGFVSGCCFDNFCLNTYYSPFSGYDGNYVSAGTYDGYSYFTGGTTPGYIYYNTGDTQWCLSWALGGACLLFGASPCQSLCPDICEDLFNGNICPTPTPSPTVNCSLNDFSALFDCKVIETPTPTPTLTTTPTPTPSVTPTIDPCSLAAISFTVNYLSPTPTPTPTATPIPYIPPFNCNIVDQVVFNTLTGHILCPGEVLWFVDCDTNANYYTAEVPYSGGSYSVGDTFISYIDSNSYQSCISFSGAVSGESNVNQVQLISLVGVGCNSCIIPSPTPTKSPTPTPTVTTTVTVTPTLPIGEYYHVYRGCPILVSQNPIEPFIIQTVPTPGISLNEFFKFAVYPAGSVDFTCWEYILIFNGSYINLASYIMSISTNPIINLQSGDYFSNNGILGPPPPPNNPYTDCSRCNNAPDTLYVYRMCDTDIYVYQLIPTEVNGTPIDTVNQSFFDATTSTCWYLRLITEGTLDTNNQPISATVVVSPTIPHNNPDYWLGKPTTGPFPLCQCN